MKSYTQVKRESGAISILTVALFIVLFSVLTVGFSRIMASMSRQTHSDELHARAIASAESGIEDAKRILTFCAYNDFETACDLLSEPLGAQNCNDIIQAFALHGITSNQPDTPNQVTIGDGDDAQHYLCLQISRLTGDFTGQVTGDGRSVIIPLNFVDEGRIPTPARTVTIEWQRTDEFLAVQGGSAFPSINQWTGPAVLRAELVRVPESNFTVNDLVTHARAVTLRPTSGSDSGGSIISPIYDNETGEAWDMEHWVHNVNPGLANEPLMAIHCNRDGAYFCSFTFTNYQRMIGGPIDEIRHYLRLQGIYRDARFRITARDADGNQLFMYGGQPEIDVTGRALDAFHRVRARVELNFSSDENNAIRNWWPEYAIDSGGVVCKDITIRRYDGIDNCATL